MIFKKVYRNDVLLWNLEPRFLANSKNMERVQREVLFKGEWINISQDQRDNQEWTI